MLCINNGASTCPACHFAGMLFSFSCLQVYDFCVLQVLFGTITDNAVVIWLYGLVLGAFFNRHVVWCIFFDHEFVLGVMFCITCSIYAILRSACCMDASSRYSFAVRFFSVGSVTSTSFSVLGVVCLLIGAQHVVDVVHNFLPSLGVILRLFTAVSIDKSSPLSLLARLRRS